MRRTMISLGLLAAAGMTIMPTVSATADESAPTPWKLFDTSSDIDGDGSIDGVAMRRVDASTCAVKAILGEGRAAIVKVPTPNGQVCSYHGSALVDDEAGAEITVRTAAGPDVDRYTMLTWQDGSLVKQKSPDRPRWRIEGGGNSVEGWARTHSKSGEVRLVHHQVTRDSRSSWSGTRDVFEYDGDDWARVGGSEVSITPRAAANRAGWRFSGLPAFG